MRCVISVLALNTMKLIIIILVGYVWFPHNLEFVFLTTLLKNESQELFTFVSSPLGKHFLGIMDILLLAVMNVSFSEKDL